MLTGAARLAGVLGWPVKHSRSPALHGHWLERYEIDGAYLPLGVRPEAFVSAVRSLVDLGFAGANVTVPHKEAALALADSASDLARRVGAANTLIFGADGTVHADNTDVFGFAENLRQQVPDIDITAGPALVLGAGGAARAVVVALQERGCPEIRLANRTRERAEALAADLAPGARVCDWDDLAGAAAGAALTVNTTSLGMEGQPPLPFDAAWLAPTAVAADIVYVPLRPPFLRDAAARGHRIAEGLGMLLHQARPGFEAWFGVAPEVTDDLATRIAADIPRE